MSKTHLDVLLNDGSEQVEEAQAAAEKLNKQNLQNSINQSYIVAVIQNRAKEVRIMYTKFIFNCSMKLQGRNDVLKTITYLFSYTVM